MPEAEPDDLALLREAAAEGGRIAMRYFRKSPEVWMKEGTSPVSEADYAVDKYLRETLTAARPSYGWLSEETADTPARLNSRRLFIVDPIDGTRGFLDGRGTWCVCIAVVEDGIPIMGVLDCPAAGEHYWAARGQGAWMNGRRIDVRQRAEDFEIGGPDRMFDLLPADWQERSKRVSYIPSLAYRLLLIASGRLDASFVKPNARDWDLAAAVIVLEEAGGRLVGADGDSPRYGRDITTHGALAAGSGPLLDAMTGAINSKVG